MKSNIASLMSALRQPSDNSESIKICAALGGTALLLYIWCQPNNPKSGDLGHWLPFGGVYKDGNKFVRYNSPLHTAPPFWLLIAIPLAFFALTHFSYFSNTPRRRVTITHYPLCGHFVCRR
ncbi:movement protein 2 [Sugarcane striate mosaic-associated virus]|uniref:Movement protein TGB2 n=1 Tax=Sugarcane striate mosaic-associated virus TaxID=167927 RepID=Q91BP5_9VIRU|nr:movement protein 2 [Sugarcane striate mosaic-associated virus]AAL05446.1 movement protein 2 [Sugarcane striate mosaic-associated virus]